jgi:divalent metal cation (Fe/Co/Zn/Cd) transporter
MPTDGRPPQPKGTPKQMPALKTPRRGAVAFGALVVIGLAWLIPYVNWTLGKFDWAFRPLPTGAVFILFLLALPINTLLKRFRPRWAFTGSELLLIYAMMVICGALASEGLVNYAAANSVWLSHYSTSENQFAQIIQPNVPLWLQVTDPSAANWLFEGKPPGAAIPWGVWLTPMVAWSSFALALYTACFCLGCLVRKDWIEEQRLSFPIAVLPIEMADDPVPSAASPFFRNRLMWIGFSLPVAQSLLQVANAFAPAVPSPSMFFYAARSLVNNGIWDSLSNIPVYIGFETIGILTLMPAEVSLSLWVFYVVSRAQGLGFAVLGFGQEGMRTGTLNPGYFMADQEAGAAIMLAALLLWQSRRAISSALRGLLGRPAPHDPFDPISPGSALLLFLLSLVFMGIWARLAGMSVWAFAIFMAIFLAFSLSLARLVAAAGVYVPDMRLRPRDLLVGATGAAAYSPSTLTALAFVQSTLMWTWKVNPLHYSLNDFKIMRTARLPGKLAAFALLLATLLMLAIAPWTGLHAIYNRAPQMLETSALSATGWEHFEQLANSLRTPEAADSYLPVGVLFGAVVMFVLHWLHSSFIWWGISPIGFVMGSTWGLAGRIWANAFIAWCVTAAMMRFGGLPLYRKSRPLFLGMVLGSFVVLGLRSLVDPVLGLHMQLSAWWH